MSGNVLLFGEYPSEFTPGITVGASVGDRFRLMFEYNLIWHATEGQASNISSASYGLGLQHTW